MLKLCENYSHKPAAELPLLFQRILQNTIHDHFRRNKTRANWTSLLSNLFAPKHEDESGDDDPLDSLLIEENSSCPTEPQSALEQAELIASIEQALAELSPRQREAFLLRYWEDLDITETASVMGCTEGSVKTHCFRATTALGAALKKKGVIL